MCEYYRWNYSIWNWIWNLLDYLNPRSIKAKSFINSFKYRLHWSINQKMIKISVWNLNLKYDPFEMEPFPGERIEIKLILIDWLVETYIRKRIHIIALRGQMISHCLKDLKRRKKRFPRLLIVPTKYFKWSAAKLWWQILFFFGDKVIERYNSRRFLFFSFFFLKETTTIVWS